MRILVTGGNGMVGTHLKEVLPSAMFPTRKELDLLDGFATKEFIRNNKPTHIVHAAAKVGGIADNISVPCDFFEENTLINLNIVKASKDLGVENLLAVLSTCAFPDVVSAYPMSEEMLHTGPPAPTNLAYGYAKRCMSVHIDAINKQHHKQYNYVIPCNLYSEFDKVHNENKMHFVTSLVKKIIEAERTNQNQISLFGTGKPLRQFMYAGDLAEIIKIVLEENIKDSFCVCPDNHNFSIDHMAKTVLKALDKNHIKINYDKSKPDGQFRKDVSNTRMRKYIPNFRFKTLENTIEKVYKEYAKR